MKHSSNPGDTTLNCLQIKAEIKELLPQNAIMLIINLEHSNVTSLVANNDFALNKQ